MEIALPQQFLWWAKFSKRTPASLPTLRSAVRRDTTDLGVLLMRTLRHVGFLLYFMLVTGCVGHGRLPDGAENRR